MYAKCVKSNISTYKINDNVEMRSGKDDDNTELRKAEVQKYISRSVSVKVAQLVHITQVTECWKSIQSFTV